MSKRAAAERESVVAEYDWADTETTAIISNEKKTSWWTFAGSVLNGAIAFRLGQRLGNVQYDNFALHFKGQRPIRHVLESIREMLEEAAEEMIPPVTDEVREDYKFGQCVPDLLLDKMIGMRFSSKEAWHEVKRREPKVVHVR